MSIAKKILQDEAKEYRRRIEVATNWAKHHSRDEHNAIVNAKEWQQTAAKYKAQAQKACADRNEYQIALNEIEAALAKLEE